MVKKSDDAAPAGGACPQCGATMIANPAPDERAMVKELVASGSPVPYATHFAAQHHEKQAAHGVVHTCPACGYTLRVKDAA